MRPACSRPTKPTGVSLIELMVAVAITSALLLAAFKILQEGGRYLQINQKAIDAQRSGLALLNQVGSGLQTAQTSLISTDAQGVVFASPFKDNGTVDFDTASQKLNLQKWVCFYYDGTTVTRRERVITLPSPAPSPVPAPASFSGDDVKKIMGKEVTKFQVTEVSTTPVLFRLEVTFGDMSAADQYGIELQSEVSPRN